MLFRSHTYIHTYITYIHTYIHGARETTGGESHPTARYGRPVIVHMGQVVRLSFRDPRAAASPPAVLRKKWEGQLLAQSSRSDNRDLSPGRPHIPAARPKDRAALCARAGYAQSPGQRRWLRW